MTDSSYVKKRISFQMGKNGFSQGGNARLSLLLKPVLPELQFYHPVQS